MQLCVAHFTWVWDLCLAQCAYYSVHLSIDVCVLCASTWGIDLYNTCVQCMYDWFRANQQSIESDSLAECVVICAQWTVEVLSHFHVDFCVTKLALRQLHISVVSFGYIYRICVCIVRVCLLCVFEGAGVRRQELILHCSNISTDSRASVVRLFDILSGPII